MDIKIIPELPQLVTHAVGFLITLWILKRYAWGPLLSLMEERRSRIKSEFDTIEEEKAKAAELSSEYQGKLKDIDRERRERLTDAVTEGKKIAEEIRTQARDEAREIATKAKEDIERDVAKAKVQLKDDMVALTLGATEKVIRERLDDAKHRQLIADFIDKLEKV